MQNPYQPLSESDLSTVVFEYEPDPLKEDSYQSEAQLEKEFIDILCSQGYEYVKLSNINEFEANLKLQIEKLNNFSFSPKEWNEFYRGYIANDKDSFKEKAKKIQEDYIHTLRLEDGSSKNIKLLDKNNIFNNSLQVINQYEVDGAYKNRYDVSVLVNGLPLVHIELKKRGVVLKEAFNQIKRYVKDSFWANGGIFEYVQIFVISNGVHSKYYSNTTREIQVGKSKKADSFEFTSYWADARNKTILDLMDFAKTFFAKHTLLNILMRYCVFTSNEDLLVMRPYQIVATESILRQINIAHLNKNYGSVANGGYIWHTTGSGKTLTSFKTAQLATQLDYIHKVLFIVDRKDLDYQTMKEYDKFKKDSANSNANTRILKEQLQDPHAKIIITTIQKLDKFIKSNNEHVIFDKEIVMIFDECHRSQLGSMHKAIIRAFKKYYLFGFTGTPIFVQNCDKNNPKGTTEEKFGVCLHRYTIVDAIKDKNVLPFRVSYINTMKGKENIADKKVQAIDTQKALLDERRITNIVDYVLQNFAHITKHNESYTFNKLENIQEIARNFKKAEEKRVQMFIRGFNSIFACSGIDAVKKYYEAFKRKEHNLKIAAIFSYSANEDLDGLDDENNEGLQGLDVSSRDFLENAIQDYNAMFSTNYDTSDQGFQNYYKDVSLRMKDREIDILIVANMFLTGFDATTLNTLWVDKNLKYHGLIQAFSRTNRILNSIKNFGNIICFRNLENELNEALSLFSNENSRGIILLRKYEDYYFGYNDGNKEYEGYKTLIDKLLKCFPLREQIVGETKQKEFIKLYGKILKIRNILECFDEFKNDNLIDARDLQDYQGMYLDLYREIRVNKEQKEEINDDIVFEIELIKQIEINIDYILRLIKDYAEAKIQEQVVIKQKIESGLNASLEMHNKKDLILKFVERINPQNQDVILEFEKFIAEARLAEFEQIMNEHKLPEQETYQFIKKAFEYGHMDFKGTEFPKLLPKEHASFFSKTSNREATKAKIANVLIRFFERFYSISSSVFDNETIKQTQD